MLDTSNPAATSEISIFALPESSGRCTGAPTGLFIATDLAISIGNWRNAVG